jgi:hypothetical protein
MTSTIGSVELNNFTAGYEPAIPLPAPTELLGVTQVGPDRAVLSYRTEGGSNYQPVVFLVVPEWQALPDRDLRWLGSFTVPGYHAPMHVFEVQS